MNRWLSGLGHIRVLQKMAAFFVVAMLCVSTHSLTGCEGGSTGVDNPGLSNLPVDFEDGVGGEVAVSGRLEIFAREHNPALDTVPLMRVEFQSLSSLQLTAEDFSKIGTASVREMSSLSKRSTQALAAGIASATESDGIIHFNLIFRSGNSSTSTNSKGATALGFTFDPKRKQFGREMDTEFLGVKLNPQSLIRFTAQFHSNSIHETLGRIYLPGTPFQGTLVDSVFALNEITPGEFPAHFLAADGKIFAIREMLNTANGATSFNPIIEPIAQLKTNVAPVEFAVHAGENREARIGETIDLNGQLVAVDSNDSRISTLWRWLPDTASGPVTIANATNLHSSILFSKSGTYHVEFSATLGITTQSDTVQIKVGEPAIAPSFNFINPKPADSLFQGQEYKVVWEAPIEGLARLEYSVKEGAEGSWILAGDSLSITPGTSGFVWVPPTLDGVTTHCLLRMIQIPGDSIFGQTPSAFFLIH